MLTGRLTHFDAAVLCLTVCCSELTEQTHSADLLSECQSLRQGCVQGQSHDQPFLPLSLFTGYTARTQETRVGKAFFYSGLIGVLVGEIGPNSGKPELPISACPHPAIIYKGQVWQERLTASML